MYVRSLIVLGLVLLLTATVAGAAEPDFEPVGGYGGAYNGVWYDGDNLFAAHYEGVTIFDVSDPSDPEEIGFILTPGGAWDVEVAAGYAYIADGAHGLAIANVSDPTSPELVSTLEMDWFGLGVAVRGVYCYVSDADAGFVSVDIRDPANPVEADRVDTDGYACDAIIDGDFAHLADGSGGLVIFDISDPTDIRIEGTLDTAGYALDVDQDGDDLFLADRQNGLLIIDVSVKSLPVLKGQYDTDDEAWGVAVDGDFAYVADYGTGLVVVDVSNVNLPELEGTMDTGGQAVNIVKVDDEVYIADRAGGMVTADVSVPDDPAELGVFDTIGMGQDVEADDDHVYVADMDDLWVLDHSDRYHPTKMSVYSHGNVTSRYGAGLALQDGYVYMSLSNEGLVVVDVSDPSDASLAGQYDTLGVAEGVDVDGDHAYVADGENGLVIVDVSDPTDPALAGSVSTGSDVAEDVFIDGNYAYMANGEDGLVIVDVSVKSAPTVVGSFNTLGHSFDVEVRGDYAYVADGSNGLAIIDCSNKFLPVQVGRHDTEGWSMLGVTVYGNYAYLADNLYGVVILNVSIKSSPSVVDHYDTPDATTKIVVVGNHAFVADRYNGLMVGRVNDTLLPPNASIDSIEPDPALVGETVRFNGSAEGGSGSYDRYVWSSDIDGELYDGGDEGFSHNGSSAGTHNITFRVRDTEGRWSGNVSSSLRVHERPTAEIRGISPDPAVNDEAIVFRGNGSDDGSVERYVWTSDLDGELYDGPDNATEASGLSPGGHSITLRVMDDDGVWSENATSTLRVHARPTCSIGEIAPSPVLQGESVGFAADAGDDGSVETYVWTSDIDGELYNGSSGSFSSGGLSLGDHDVSLKVQDDDGAWSGDAHGTVRVHTGPTATIVSISPSPAVLGDEVAFQGSGSDDGSVVRYEWTSDLDGELYAGGDGSFSTDGLSIGMHEIRFRVRDDDGVWSDEETETLVVSKPDDEWPTVVIEEPGAGDTVSGTVTISGTASDADGTITSVEIRIDVGEWHEAEGTTSWEYGWDTSDVDDGTHTIEARSSDGSQWSLYDGIGVTVRNDVEPPDGGGENGDDDEESLYGRLTSPIYCGAILVLLVLVAVMAGLRSGRRKDGIEVVPVAVVSGPACAKCGGSTALIREYDRFYCHNCQEYV